MNLIARRGEGDPSDVVMVELSVRDTGIGMSEETLEHLFDAFTQADSSTSRRFGGTGLGLAISRQLVELMGGTLTATSELGTGSTFTALIPFPLATGAAGHTDAADLTGVRVLIVDDNATNQRVLQEMVAGWGCTAVVTDGAAQALVLLLGAVAAAEPFDVLLLDLHMPDIDGYGLARMVSAETRLAGTPMVMLTSSAQRGEAERTAHSGIVAYLTKPVRSAQLRAALDIALGPAVPVMPSGQAAKVAEPFATVLVVEDDAVNQKVITAMLATIGYRSDVAANGFDALAALERNKYAAVFMDCQMPLMDGYEATEKLREREGADRHTHVIAVTATAMAGDRERCLSAGMDDYLSKPFSPEALAAVLARCAPALDAAIVGRLERMGEQAGEDLMGELTDLFLADAEVHVVAIRQALAARDADAVVRSAHLLGGAGANLGATGLARMCARLESDGAGGDLDDGEEQLDALESEFGRVRSALTARVPTR